MRIIVIATGALAWRPSHRTVRRAAPVDHASDEEAWWRDMNMQGDASVAPPPAPPPTRKARRLDAGAHGQDARAIHLLDLTRFDASGGIEVTDFTGDVDGPAVILFESRQWTDARAPCDDSVPGAFDIVS